MNVNFRGGIRKISVILDWNSVSMVFSGPSLLAYRMMDYFSMLW